MLAWINPDKEPKAVLLCVHGLGLQSNSYEDFGKRMSALGIATYSVDVRGFGSFQNAPQKSRNLVNFEDCEGDVVKILKTIHRIHPNLPVFLLGESMGGAIALRVTAENPNLVDGLISCTPSADRFGAKRAELKVALHFLKGPNKKFDVGSQVIEQASEKHEVGTEKTAGELNCQLKHDWATDPLARKDLSPKELLHFQKFMNENHQKALLIKDRPVLMVQGMQDNLVKPTGTIQLWTELPTIDKEIRLFPQARHLIFEESESNDKDLNVKVDKMVDRWVDDHLTKNTQSLSQAKR
jgi:alpha-beta hydrolase superfamily lysophospholipase